MFRSIDAFLSYFDGVQRRALRDIGALPPEADGWRPPAGAGEKAWPVNTIVGHIAGARLYFVSAYRGEGWISPTAPDVSSRDRWLPALQDSYERLRGALAGTPDAWLERKIPLIDSDGSISGWRILLLMAEHDIHHRSQLDTYAGLNGWDPPQIYDRAWEQVEAKQPEQRARYGRA